MKIKRKMSRYALARRLHFLALRISAGKPVRIGSKSMDIPDYVVLEEEFELTFGEADLELEIHWPLRTAKSSSGKLEHSAAQSGQEIAVNHKRISGGMR